MGQRLALEANDSTDDARELGEVTRMPRSRCGGPNDRLYRPQSGGYTTPSRYFAALPRVQTGSCNPRLHQARLARRGATRSWLGRPVRPAVLLQPGASTLQRRLDEHLLD